MGLVIDGFAHVMPKRFLEILIKVHPSDELKELVPLTYFGDMKNRVRVLDKYKIDKQVLTLGRPSIWLNVPQNQLPDLTRQANDAVAEVARQYPDRFIATGTLPMPSAEFLPEFDRCINELGMAGIQVFSNMDGKPLDAPEFRAFFAKANATKTPVWLHPQLQHNWSQEFVLDKSLGWVYETSIAISRLVFSGIMEEYPDLRIIPHHMGAMIPHFSERLKGFYEARSIFPRSNFISLPRDPLDYFRRFYGDSVVTGSAHAFECGYKFLGPGHIIFATDYPFGPKEGEGWIEADLNQLKTADLPQSEKDMIFGENLLKLIQRK